MTTKRVGMDFLLPALAATALLMMPATPLEPSSARADGVVEGSLLALETSATADAAPANATQANASHAAAEAVLASTSSSLFTPSTLSQSCDDNSCYEYCSNHGFNAGSCISGLVCWCY